jgi:hypothetical protein
MLRDLETPDVVNRDNELLHPWGRIGRVDEVNGRGAVEMSEFVPTRHELLQLVKYWMGVVLDRAFDGFLYEYSCSEAIRLKPFAMRRIDRIADCCGEDCVRHACREAEDAFAQTVDAEAWQVFRHGTPEEQAAFHDKLSRDVERASDQAETRDDDWHDK